MGPSCLTWVGFGLGTVVLYWLASTRTRSTVVYIDVATAVLVSCIEPRPVSVKLWKTGVNYFEKEARGLRSDGTHKQRGKGSSTSTIIGNLGLRALRKRCSVVIRKGACRAVTGRLPSVSVVAVQVQGDNQQAIPGSWMRPEMRAVDPFTRRRWKSSVASKSIRSDLAASAPSRQHWCQSVRRSWLG
jgi:hypothetical protein